MFSAARSVGSGLGRRALVPHQQQRKFLTNEAPSLFRNYRPLQSNKALQRVLQNAGQRRGLASAATAGVRAARLRSILMDPKTISAFIAGNVLLQVLFGSADGEIINSSYWCAKDPDDLAEFYEAHDLLEVMMPCPALFHIVMDLVSWDGEPPSETKPCLLTMEESRCFVHYVGMDVGFEIFREEDDDGKLIDFCRYERFIHNIPFLTEIGIKIPVCESTWKFGFRKLKEHEKSKRGYMGRPVKANEPDDEVDQFLCYHRCVNYQGLWLFRAIMTAHMAYVAWGCEKIVNNECFGPHHDDEALEEELRRQIGCVPLYELRKALGGSG
ncbi:unnamed protein product [Amoebophrya sp. A25]|nr:unnamed protein product [Amoebophrya sp. A25]|eukprot:GSA25T00025386001.1